MLEELIGPRSSEVRLTIDCIIFIVVPCKGEKEGIGILFGTIDERKWSLCILEKKKFSAYWCVNCSFCSFHYF